MSAATKPQGLCPAGAEIFARVVDAMQSAEELGGPAGADYMALMSAISMEAVTRGKAFAEANWGRA